MPSRRRRWPGSGRDGGKERGALGERVHRGWIGKQTRHEGFPLALRVLAGFDEDWPGGVNHLAVLTHAFDAERVREDGMPKGDDNRSLADFDAFVHDAIAAKDGSVLIVETFGGKRCYYAGVRRERDAVAWLSEVRARFVEHRVSLEYDADGARGFYARYRGSEFGW